MQIETRSYALHIVVHLRTLCVRVCVYARARARNNVFLVQHAQCRNINPSRVTKHAPTICISPTKPFAIYLQYVMCVSSVACETDGTLKRARARVCMCVQ